MRIRFVPILLVAAMPLLFTSCTLFKKKTPQYAGVDGDSVSGTPLPERQEGVSFMDGNVDKSKFSPVHFAFDSYSVSSSEEGKIHEVADYLKHGSSSVIVAGFTDERGTPEYNRGLGERRAQSVRESLLQAGVSPAKVQTVSFGAEMPVDSASNDSAWAKNRRAEFGITR